jgi:mRNA interferase RelE/StbE
MAKYNIFFKKSAEKELDDIPNEYLQKIIEKVRKLETNPRPPYSRKLSNYNLFRVRQGDYRIVYFIDDEKHELEIIKIGHRKEIYRF